MPTIFYFYPTFISHPILEISIFIYTFMPAGPSAEAMSGETLKRLRYYLAVLEISIFIYTFMPAGPYAEAMSGEILKELRKFIPHF